jgi:DNA-binding Lrp family transcriptional regulator
MENTMKAYVLIKIRAGEVKDVVRQLRTTDKIAEANMTFGPYDAVAIIESPDISSLGNLIASAIQPIPGVEQTLTCLAVEI